MTIIGDAFVEIKPDSSKFASAAKGDIEKQSASLGSTAAKAFGAAFSIAAALKIGKDVFAEADEARKVGALTNAVLKSTGGIANVTAKDVEKLSTSISNLIGVDDEAIQKSANLLLTFTKVRNEAGKGNDIFNQTVLVAQDMAAALGKDASGAVLQLGKALNDPVKGINALTRAGVSFTAQQKEQIKALVASGDLLGAQKLILAELNTEFKGAAESQATSEAKLGVVVKNIEESLGTALLPAIDAVATGLTVALPHALDIAANALAPAVNLFAPLVHSAEDFITATFDPAKGAFGKSRWELGLGVIQDQINNFLLGKGTNTAATAAEVAKNFGIPEVRAQGPAIPSQGGLLGLTVADVQHDATILAIADQNASTFDKVIAKTGNTIAKFFHLDVRLNPSDLHLGEGFDVIKSNFLAGSIEVRNFLSTHGGEEAGKAVLAIGDATAAAIPVVGRDIKGAIQAVGRFLGDSPSELGGNLVDAGSKIGFLVLDGIATGAQAAVGGVVTRVVGIVVGTVNAIGATIDAILSLPNRLFHVGEAIVNGIVNGILAAGSEILKAIVSFIPKPSDVVNIFKKGAGLIGGAVGSFFGATGGTVTSGGFVVVGEKGPELVRLPTGAQVISNGFGNVQPGPVSAPALAASANAGSTFHVEQMIVPAPPDASPLEVASTIAEHFAWRFGMRGAA